MIDVLRSGPLNTVQDLGRKGAMRLGIGRSGAMDPAALRLGNILLANPQGAAAIEVVFFPFDVRFAEHCAFAVAGAPVRALLEGRSLPPNFAAWAEPGQVLTLEPSRAGVFAYLCLEGGIDAPFLLGSRATDLKSRYGGLDARGVKQGDRLLRVRSGRVAAVPPAGLGASIKAVVGDLAGPVAIRFIPAAEWDLFGADVRRLFLIGPWTVSRDVNRMGYRLSGPALEPGRRVELFSHGVTPGVIQVPPNGQPIVQMVEANTCGGYPKLGVVIAVDLPRLAQQRSGREVVFVQVGRDEALAARAAQEAGLRTLEVSLQFMRERVP